MNKKAKTFILCLAVSVTDTLVGAHVLARGNRTTAVINHASNASQTAAETVNTVLDLNAEQSRQYINDTDGLRAKLKPGQQVRLNLGDDFKKYMVDNKFRVRVDAFVSGPLKQIWSDVSILDLSGSEVEDISALAGLTNLRRLILADTPVKDISPLARLVNLEFLNLSQTQVRSISQLKDLGKLKNLYLADTQVKDIAPLAGLENLEALNLSYTEVQNIRPLAGLRKLQRLDLSETQVQDITPLSGLGNLKQLCLSDTPVENIMPLAHLVNLEWLNLSNTRAKDFTPLCKLKNTNIQFSGSAQIKRINCADSIWDKIVGVFGSFFSDTKRMR